MQRFEAGASIDGFELVERLQSGSMASLWRAKNPKFDFPLLLKIPFLDPGGDVSVILGFEAEEMILKRLSGPHVPRFAASGGLAEVPYIAMEFVAGVGLAETTGRAPLRTEQKQHQPIRGGNHEDHSRHRDHRDLFQNLQKRGAIALGGISQAA